MELTGKCKRDFEKWFNGIKSIPVFGELLSIDVQYGATYDAKDCFHELLPSMQYGIIIEFLNETIYKREALFDYFFKFYFKIKNDKQQHIEIVWLSIKDCVKTYNTLELQSNAI